MALADLATVKKRLIQLINANPGAWSASVSGTVGAFFSDDEITQACLEADSNVACQGYANSVNDSLANPFQVTTAPFADRDNVPFHHGDLSKVEVSTSTQTFTAGASNVLTTATAHGWATGQLVTAITTSALPTGLTVLTNYYVIVDTATTLKLATSVTNAFAGTAVAVTNGSGSGTNTLIAWQIGVEAKSVDEITNATNGMNVYVSGTSTNPSAYNFLYRSADGLIYTTARYWRATHFEYTQTAALQCNQNETSLLVFEAAALLAKNASPSLFPVYRGYADRGIQQLVMDGQYTAQVNEAGIPSPST